MEERFKFRRVNEITGTFVLVVVAVLIATVMWAGHSQRWFKSRVTLRIVLPEAGAAGIRQGSEVYFLGTLVGSVSDVVVDETGRMEAEANIRRDFFRFVRADSSAVVKKKFGVAGDSFFEITRGQGRPLPEKNASIVCNEQFQSALESAIEEIRRETLARVEKNQHRPGHVDQTGRGPGRNPAAPGSNGRPPGKHGRRRRGGQRHGRQVDHRPRPGGRGVKVSWRGRTNDERIAGRGDEPESCAAMRACRKSPAPWPTKRKTCPGWSGKRRLRCANWSGWLKPCNGPGSCANT